MQVRLALVLLVFGIATGETAFFGQVGNRQTEVNKLAGVTAAAAGDDATPRLASAEARPETYTARSEPQAVSPIVRRDSVEVLATGQATDPAIQTYHVTSEEILSSAGTYGDFSRYLQQFPGVVFNSDQSDDVLVRGGHPMENLFLVDGFEVPNLNHLSSEGTTGGFTSMIDTNSIQNLEMRPGGYDSSYAERLSSVIEIRTRELPSGTQRHIEADAGIVGAGALFDTHIKDRSALLLTAHRSLLNLFTNDIGLNGVPTYTNAMATLRLNESESNRFTALSLNGMDSIDIRPCPGDNWETSTIDTSYQGWRTTQGFSWQHIYSPTAFSQMSVSDTEGSESIHQVDQILNVGTKRLKIDCSRGVPLVGTPVYNEHTLDGSSSARYDLNVVPERRVTLLTGAAANLAHPSFAIAQPAGAQSPLTVDASRTDADSFRRQFSSGGTGFYLQSNLRPTGRWSLGFGGRGQTFAFGGHFTATPRANAAFRVNDHFDLHVAYGKYAQMPPLVDLVSYPQNHALRPIRATHYIVGSNVSISSGSRLGIEAYRKEYTEYPVSSEYPTLSMANMVEMMGQQFLWLPFTSAGRGRTEGIELFGQTSWMNRLRVQGTAAYSRAKFARLDGILRPSNLDFPVVLNAAGTYAVFRGLEGAFRYEYATGRPYTPFLLSASLAQDRPIFDLSQVNAKRAPYYSRLDFQINKRVAVHDHSLVIYAGMENALDRKNFLGYAWEPRVGAMHNLKLPLPIGELHQMPHFPNIGVRFIF